MTKDGLYNLIQKYLNTTPVVIWGSGATASFGLPSMGDLKAELAKTIPSIGTSTDNLEIELGKEIYNSRISEIKKIIWSKIRCANDDALRRLITNPDEFNGIRDMVKKFYENMPQLLNIVTTNYDLLLEYTIGYCKIPYTTGFYGCELSSFNKNEFKEKNCVNILKVHGSLNWAELNEETCQLSNYTLVADYIPSIITPGKNKYQNAFCEPYRDIIAKSDDVIRKASCFMAVGFGFNDEHLTPVVKQRIKEGKPIVVITKEISKSTLNELREARKYVLIEEDGDNKTKYSYKNDADWGNEIFDDNNWQLSEFVKNIL